MAKHTNVVGGPFLAGGPGPGLLLPQIRRWAGFCVFLSDPESLFNFGVIAGVCVVIS